MEFKTTKTVLVVNRDHWVRVSLGHMMASGVFQRFPKLKVLSVEHGTSWVPHFLERMDFYHKAAARRGGPSTAYGMNVYDGGLPSEVFQRNIFVTFEEDPFGLRNRYDIGVENMCWGSDYPHPESTFPNTKNVLKHIFDGVPEHEKAKILCGNVARIYGIR